MRCGVCNRNSESEFCERHKKAYENLMKAYKVWEKSLGISWIEYLCRIRQNANAGLWVKEVVQHLLVQNARKKKSEHDEISNI
ncbi:MAG: hypothetical protein QXX08_07085 [Candidatus Bathyarchaeia archaeon]